MKKVLVLILGIILVTSLFADLREQAVALTKAVNVQFSPTPWEIDRDAKITELLSLTKGEFETTALFEQRKKDAGARATAIRAEYAQKINDARIAHEAYIAKLRVRLNSMLAQSRETIRMGGSLESYDADNQRYTFKIAGKTFQITVPLAQAPGVKKNWGKYVLTVMRQLNDKLEWDYLEAKLTGEGYSFSSTDKAPALENVASGNKIIPPNLTASLSFSEANGNQYLDAEETATLTLTISNSGKGTASMVQANISAVNATGIDYDKSVYFGEIEAGASLSKTLNLKASENITDANVKLSLDFSEQNGFPPDAKKLSFSTRAQKAPDLVMADVGIEDFNQNGKIEPGETVEITIRIQNKGQGRARQPIARLDLGTGVYLSGETNSAEIALSDLQPGAFQDIRYSIVTAKTTKSLSLCLDLRESRANFNKTALPLNLAFNRVEKSAEQFIITGKDNPTTISDAPNLNIDVEQNIPVFGKANKNRWAVIIGIENYQRVGGVTFARRDANYIRDYFEKTLGIPAANTYIALDDKATLGELRKIFDAGWLDQNAGNKSSEIYVYYAGHGAPAADGTKAYLIPYDGDPNYPQQTGYELNTLYANLAKLPVKQVTLFMDACFSGVDREQKILLANSRPVTLSIPHGNIDAKLNIYSATSGAQYSSAWPEMSHGLFSYYLMKGMGGEADQNKDKKISVGELDIYLKENVSPMARRLGREQDPGLDTADREKILIDMH